MRIPTATRDFARQLRRNQTDAERRLWYHLRGCRLLGMRFRRQHPIGPYYADFACLEIRLVVELDDGQHNQPNVMYRDAVRTEVLAAHGFEVIRFWDNDVLRDTAAVLETIARRIRALTPALSRSAGEGVRVPSPTSVGEG